MALVKQFDVTLSAAAVLDFLLCQYDLADVLWLAARRSEKINHEAERVLVSNCPIDPVQRRVRGATAVPVKLVVDADAGKTRGHRTAGHDMVGSQFPILAIEEN